MTITTPQLSPMETGCAVADDWMNDKSYEWCEAALAAGYDSDNPPPLDWEPNKTVIGVDVASPEGSRTVISEIMADGQVTVIPDGSPRAKDIRDRASDLVIRPTIDGLQRNGVLPVAEYKVDYPDSPLRSLRPVDISSPPAPKKGLAARLGMGAATQHPDTSPHLIVEARAGTGKTTTLIEGLKPLVGMTSSLVPSPQQRAVWDAMALSTGKAKSFCFVAFNKSIATELQQRVPPGVCAMTMHSMGYSAIRNAVGRNVKVESYRVGNILSELLERDIRDLRKDKFDVMKAVEELVGLCKMNLVGFRKAEETLPYQDTDDYWAEELDRLSSHYEVEMLDGTREEVYALVPRVLERCKDVRSDMEIDFNDMIWLPVVLSLPVTRYDILLVDERQDLNRCQMHLALKAGHRIIAVGDERQSIYGFAGADVQACKILKVMLEETDRGVTEFPLTVTRRCGKAIVREAQKIVPDFEALPDAHEGRVSCAKYPDAKTSKVLTEKERELNPDYTSQVKEGDFILCRVNAPLVSQCFRFIKQGRKATIQGRDIGKGLVTLVNKFRASSVVDLVSKLSDWLHKETQKENAKRNPSEARLIALGDKHDCLIAFTEGANTVDDVARKIESVFVDDKNAPGIRLSSIHRAKGLESHRVFFLMPESGPCPHPMAKSAWQKEQERNLLYVGVTRAIEELIFVS